ncbi:SDR family NAD(P)-dependent oxidoreductase [Jatrophihabitans sp. DSM 45814]
MTVQPDAAPLVAVVTGATSGIGKAAALRLAADGFSVVVHGRDARRGAEVVAAIEDSGGQARFVAADLTDASEIAGFAEQLGDIDVLVNNAGIAWFGPTAGLDVATYDRLFDANVRSAYFVVAAVAPKMVAHGRGSIINIGSMAGQIGMAGGAAYSATKASLASFTRSWSAEYSPSGVRVNTVSPGPVYTAVQPAEQTAAIGTTTIFGRAAQTDEIAEVIAFLASNKSSYVTGAIYAVDGGRTAI